MFWGVPDFVTSEHVARKACITNGHVCCQHHGAVPLAKDGSVAVK